VNFGEVSSTREILGLRRCTYYRNTRDSSISFFFSGCVDPTKASL